MIVVIAVAGVTPCAQTRSRETCRDYLKGALLEVNGHASRRGDMVITLSVDRRPVDG